MKKNSNEFINLLIFQSKPLNNLILAKKSEMELIKNRLNLKLYDGNKMEFKGKSFETLIYDKYNL